MAPLPGVVRRTSGCSPGRFLSHPLVSHLNNNLGSSVKRLCRCQEMILKQGDYPGLSEYISCYHRSPKKWKKKEEELVRRMFWEKEGEERWGKGELRFQRWDGLHLPYLSWKVAEAIHEWRNAGGSRNWDWSPTWQSRVIRP